MERPVFEKLAAEAFRSIPERFLKRLGNVVILVEDRPTPEQNAVGAHEGEDELDILGLYEGTPLTELPGDPSGMLPDVISLFQEPIEEEAEASGLEPFEVIRQTLIHEIGHHFGLNDEEIEKIFEERWENEP
ncbi:MAG: metallopeptidase family protein [Patescibacteria group bacterium]|nr:MAG: metallopeptidase family protein [Patescibacteria group bacterium]